MSLQLWLTLGVFGSCLALMIFSRIGPDLVLAGGLGVLLLSGILTPKQALAGFSNEAILSIGTLFVIAAALRETGVVDLVVRYVFSRPSSVFGAQVRLMIPVAFAGAFMHTTPLVASLIPAVEDWSRKIRISPSKLMIPLSYAAILGGTCTLVGTSTNLIVQGFLLAEPGQRPLSLFEPAWAGVPSAIAGIIYILVMSHWLLPARTPVVEQLKRPREYTVEMLVDDDSPLAGKSVEVAGLRQLHGVYLVEIDRDGDVKPAVSPGEILRAGDRLVFAGITESIMDLQRVSGLTPATDQVFKLDSPRPMREFIEAVVSASGPAVNKTVRESRFRTRYGAVVIAVARDGQRIVGKIGDIGLEPGDTLLLEAEAGFANRYRNSRDFLLLRPIDAAGPPRRERAGLALIIFVGIVAAAGLQWLDLFTASLVGAGLLLVTRCLSTEVARSSIDLQVIIAVACAFGISNALRTTGAGELLAGGLVSAAGADPMRSLVAIYLATVIFTEVMTHSAAAALMFPIASATAARLGIDLVPFAIAIMMAASASFATPIGYATNLMVYGPGGYRFTDFLRFGAPLNLTVALISLIVIPRIWPLV